MPMSAPGRSHAFAPQRAAHHAVPCAAARPPRPAARLAPGLLALGLWAGCAQQPSVPPKPQPTPAESAARLEAEAAAIARAAQEARLAAARQRAEEAYVYGYPLVLGEMYRQQMSGAGRPEGVRVPANTFWHARRLPPAGEPHPLVDEADTLASFAWLDLGREPMLVTHPAMGRRWFSLALHSQWMQVLEQSGSGLGDGRAARLLVSGPEWSGSVPAGVRHVRSPTRHVLLSVRILASGGAADLGEARALQSQLRIVPQTPRTRGARLAAGSAEPAAVAVPGTSPQQRVEALDTAAYFDLLAQLLGSSAAPAAADAPLLERIAALGVEPGRRFDMAALEPAVQAALADTAARALQRLRGQQPLLYAAEGGWQLLLPQADFGTDYLRRAAVALAAWPGPPPARQLLLMRTRVDAAGMALSGAHDYRLVFDRQHRPPSGGFWSLTLQVEQGGQRSFAPGGVDRVGLGSRDRLAGDADGSLPLIVQNLSPGIDDAARWLPAPKGNFMLALRLYLPRRGASWTPPPVSRLP